MKTYQDTLRVGSQLFLTVLLVAALGCFIGLCLGIGHDLNYLRWHAVIGSLGGALVGFVAWTVHQLSTKRLW